MTDKVSQRTLDRGAEGFPPLGTAEAEQSPPSEHSGSGQATFSAPRLREINEARAAAAKIRKLSGKHLVLFTDVDAASNIDELPAVFDAAFPLWCENLGLDAEQNADWQMRGYLIKDRERFQATGLWPPDLPDFLNGYTRGREFWLYNQTSDYYRRHLMLHEGVHGIMFTLQRSGGPAWYMEGMAELLATHRWQESRIALPYFPDRRADVPKLGRIEIVQRDFAQGNGMSFRDVLALENRHFLKNEPYAWSWAGAAFLYGHPAYRDRFRALMKAPAYDDFNERLKRAYADDARSLVEDWEVFVHDISHAYDFERTRLNFAPARAVVRAGAPVKLTIAADRGWQNTGLRLEADTRYVFKASGQFTLANEPKPWICEPGGVTIRYCHSRPLGILLAVVRPDVAPRAQSPFLQPGVIGAGTELTPQESGTLYLRVNDFGGELSDNTGSIQVEVAVD